LFTKEPDGTEYVCAPDRFDEVVKVAATVPPLAVVDVASINCMLYTVCVAFDAGHVNVIFKLGFDHAMPTAVGGTVLLLIEYGVFVKLEAMAAGAPADVADVSKVAK